LVKASFVSASPKIACERHCGNPVCGPRALLPRSRLSERKERIHWAIREAKGQALAYVYFEDETHRQMSLKRFTPDGAGRVAANIAKLPDLLRKS
jgi:hypothetical protein